jgi:hypothetical protein
LGETVKQHAFAADQRDGQEIAVHINDWLFQLDRKNGEARSRCREQRVAIRRRRSHGLRADDAAAA